MTDIGICTSMHATLADGTGMEHLATLARAGYYYVELPLAQLMALDEAEFNLRLNQLRASGLECRACNNMFPASMRLTGPERDDDLVREYAARALARAAALGAEVVVFGSGGARNIPRGFNSWQAVQQLEEGLNSWAEVADDYGISIAIETLNRLESNVINNLEEAVALSAMMWQTNVGCLLDTYHFILGNEPPSDLRSYHERVIHAHCAGTLGRVLDVDPDEQELRTCLKTLLAGGYSGGISLEGYSVQKDEATFRAARLALQELLLDLVGSV